MDEAIDLADYLPDSFKDSSEQEYIAFLWEAFEENYDVAKYQFAFLAYHMLMMSFVYFSIWQIRQSLPSDFAKGLIGFARDDERSLLNDASPFTFSKVNERTIFQLLRLVGCDASKIGSYKKLVDDRNKKVAHANGSIFFTRNEIDKQIRRVLNAVREIQGYCHPVVQRCYEQFLLESHDPEEREYFLAEDQIREVLIHGNYMSRKDIELCVRFDTASLPNDNKQTIEALHSTLCQVYGT